MKSAAVWVPFHFKGKGMRYLIVAFLFGIASPAFSQDSEKVVTPFGEVWKSIQTNSHGQKAANLEAKAAKIAEARASRHWLPTLYFDGRTYNTNDPAMNFMSILGQRSAGPSDFSTKGARNQLSNILNSSNQPYTNINPYTLNLLAPNNLNYPGSNTYSRGSLGFDMPLYEGGAKSAMSEAMEKTKEAKNFERKFIQLNEYTNSASLYGHLLVVESVRDKIQNLQSLVGRLLRRYEIGARSNPVGYSGLLGLKSLQNRLEGALTETDAKSESIRRHLRIEAPELPENWAPQPQETVAFAQQHLLLPENFMASYRTEAMKQYAQGAKSMAEAEKAKFLPKVGLFAQGNLYNGSRNTATSYTTGVYLQMNLISPTEMGALKEARLKSEAAREKARQLEEQEEAQWDQLIRSELAIRKNLTLLTSSEKLSEEQTQTAIQLFNRGAINALQLVEVIARRADLYLSKAEAESQYLNIRAGLLSMSQKYLEEIYNEE